MANIMFIMLPEEGHIIPSLKVAHNLRAAGHQIYYLGLLDVQDSICAEGFHFIPILTDLFPKGSRAQQVEQILGFTAQKGRAKKNRVGDFLKAFVNARFHQELCNLLLKRSLAEIVGDLSVDMLVVDLFLPEAAIAAYASDIPSVALNVTLAYNRAVLSPPLTTTLMPPVSFADRVKTRAAWSVTNLAGKAAFVSIGFRFRQYLRRLAQHYAYPVARLEDTEFFPMTRPDERMPLLVLCPSAFDFPNSDSPAVYHVEPSVEQDADQQDLHWEGFDPKKKTIFCTLGSQSHISAASKQFFQTVIDAVANQPDWQAVIAIGRHLDVKDFSHVPGNVLVSNWVPHSAMLRRSDVMIHHAGLGTIKACVFHGVPMILFPFMRDNPGNAARAVYHGLGVLGNIQRVSVDSLRSMIVTVLSTPDFRQRLAHMRKVFIEAEDRSDAVAIIERMLSCEKQR